MQKHLSAQIFALLLGAMVTLLPAQSGTVSTTQPWIVFSSNPLEDSVRNCANQLPLFEWTEDSSRNQPLHRVAYRIWGYADWQMSRFDFPQQFIQDTLIAYPVIRNQIPRLKLVYRYGVSRQDTQMYFLAASLLTRAYSFIQDIKNYNFFYNTSNLILKNNLYLNESNNIVSLFNIGEEYINKNTKNIYKIDVDSSIIIQNYYKYIIESIYTVYFKNITLIDSIRKVSEVMNSAALSVGTPMVWYEFVGHLGSALRYEKQTLDSLELYQKSIHEVSLIIPDALDTRLQLAAIEAQCHALSGNTSKAIKILKNIQKVEEKILSIVKNDTSFVSIKLILAFITCAETYGYLGNTHYQEIYGNIATNISNNIYMPDSLKFRIIQINKQLTVKALSTRQEAYGMESQGKYSNAKEVYKSGIYYLENIKNNIDINNPEFKNILNRIETESNQNNFNIVTMYSIKYKKFKEAELILNKINNNNWLKMNQDYMGRLYFYKSINFEKWYLYSNEKSYLDSSMISIKKSLYYQVLYDQDFKHKILNQIATIYTHFKRSDSAIYYFNEAIMLAQELNNKPQVAKYRLSLAEMYLSVKSPNIAEVLMLIQKIDTILPLLELSDRAEVLRYHTLRGQVATVLGDTLQGIAAFKEGIELYQNTIAYTTYQDREIWAEQLQDLHSRLLSLYVDLNDAKGAFYVAEMMKGRMLQTALEIAPLEDELLRKHHPDWLEQRKMLRAKYYNLSLTEPAGTEIHTTRAALDSLQSEMVDALPALAQYAPMPDSLPLVQASLAADESVVEYFTDRDYLYAIVIPSAKAAKSVLLKLCPVATVQTYMKAYTRHIRQYKEGQAHDSSYRVLSALYACLWQPLMMPDLAERILVVPDPLLAGLSFGSLLPPGLPVGEMVNCLNQKEIYNYFLTNSKYFSYFQSAQGILLRRKEERTAPAQPKHALVVFCDGEKIPVKMSKRANQGTVLPNGRKEARQVYDYFYKKGVKVDTLVNDSVTRAKLLQKMVDSNRYDIIWIIAHGEYDSTLNQSRIYGFNDTINEIDIIQNISSSQTRLVVLSACQSGLGKARPGEGVAGIANAFLRTGTTYVAAGLWNLDDATSKNLMTQFLEHIQTQDSFNIGEAQRQYLQLSESEDFKHPFYWAGYILYQ